MDIPNRYFTQYQVARGSDFRIQVTFPDDVDYILRCLEYGIPLEQIDLYDYAERRSRMAPDGLFSRPKTDGLVSKPHGNVPVCAICGKPGGLPCPKMLATAHRHGIVLTAPEGPHLHPGKCRAKLKHLIAVMEGKT